MGHSIPLIDIGPLFGTRSLERDLTDQAIMAAAATSGFMVVRGLPSDLPAGRAARADLLRLFQLPEHETRKLWRQKFDPAHPNVYRGWFGRVIRALPLRRLFVGDYDPIRRIQGDGIAA